jgi:hypothetical protein
MHRYFQPTIPSRTIKGGQADSAEARLLDADATRKLAEIGFLAATTGSSCLAKVIFAGLRMDQPESVAGGLGMAVSVAVSGDTSEALRILDAIVCKDEQEGAVVHAWRGLVHHLAGHNSQSRKILGQIAGAQGPGGALARRLLDEIPAPV